jgi:hypothetical protein
MRNSLTVFPHRGLSPHQFTPLSGAHNSPALRQAQPPDADKVADILREAARWLEQGGMAMGRDDALLPPTLSAD